MRANIIFLGIAALLITAEPSAACRVAGSGTTTLLDTLPENAKFEPVVARVEIIELLRPIGSTIPDDWKYTARIRVRVAEAIKGVERDQTFIIEGRGTDCDDAFPRGEPKFEAYISYWRPYIAGQFYQVDNETVFRGGWHRDFASGRVTRVWPSISWLPLKRSEIVQLTVGSTDAASLKIETSDVQKAKLTGFLPPDDTIWVASNPAIPLTIVMAGKDQNIDSLRIELPVVDYSTSQADQVSAILLALFKRLYPDWADATQWLRESLLEAWKSGQVIRKEINGISNATFGVPPDVVVYTVTTREQCVPDPSRGNPFQRPIC